MAGKKRGRKSKKQVQHGEGPIWDGIKSGLSKANDFLKKSKLISTISGIVPKETPYIGGPAYAIHNVSKALGYGQMANGIQGTGPSGNPKYAKRINV